MLVRRFVPFKLGRSFILLLIHLFLQELSIDIVKLRHSTSDVGTWWLQGVFELVVIPVFFKNLDVFLLVFNKVRLTIKVIISQHILHSLVGSIILLQSNKIVEFTYWCSRRKMRNWFGFWSDVKILVYIWDVIVLISLICAVTLLYRTFLNLHKGLRLLA